MNRKLSSALKQGDHTPVILNGTQKFMDKEIPIIVGGFGEDQKVVTDKMVAEIHGMETRNVRARITDNIKRFKDSIDFIDLKEGAYQTSTLEILLKLGYTKSAITQAEHIYLLSERGYAKLIKIMDTDLAWDIHDKLMDDYFHLREVVKTSRTQTQTKVDTKEKEIEARLINANVREANIYLKIADNVDNPTYKQIMYSKATEVLNGKALIPLPKAERKTYSATEVGERLGISSNKVGSIANKHNLKTEEYGLMVWDKSQYSSKQVETWRYYENVLPVLQDILNRARE